MYRASVGLNPRTWSFTEDNLLKCNLADRCVPEAIRIAALDFCRHGLWWPEGHPTAANCGDSEGAQISDQNKMYFDPCEVAVLATSCERPSIQVTQVEDRAPKEENNPCMGPVAVVAAVAIAGFAALLLKS